MDPSEMKYKPYSPEEEGGLAPEALMLHFSY